MAYSVQKFVSEVLAIASKQPTYRIGGTGKDGTCDCIGLIMGAMYALGRSRYDLHSTNYFSRHQTNDLRPITSELEYRYGMVVYKAREDTGELNDRYKKGGRYYTGDPLDYYHVGVVTSVMPLHITHCTSGGGVDGIKTDYAMGAWRYGGKLMGVDYAQTGEGGTAMEVLYRATVMAQSGSTVNLRESPRITGKLIERVPLGTAVDVWEDAQGWAHIQTDGGRVGYMQSKYLQRQDTPGTTETDPETGGDDVALLMPRYAAKAFFDALEKEFGNG